MLNVLKAKGPKKDQLLEAIFEWKVSLLIYLPKHPCFLQVYTTSTGRFQAF